MYNEAVKRAFISDQYGESNTAVKAERFFKRLEPYEGALAADLCTLDADTALNLLEKVVYAQAISAQYDIKIFREYLSWCTNHHVPGAKLDAIDVQPRGIEKIRTTTVKSPLFLSKFLNDVFAPIEDMTIDNVFRCLYWLAYSGVPSKDATDIKTKDVDYDEMVIRHNLREYPIYRESLPVFRACTDQVMFVKTYGTAKRWQERYPSDQLLRAIVSESTFSFLREESSRKVSKAVKTGKTDIKLTYDRAALSGIFYRIYEREVTEVDVDFVSIARDYVEPQYQDDRNKVMAMARFMRKDYNLWKSTL